MDVSPHARLVRQSSLVMFRAALGGNSTQAMLIVAVSQPTVTAPRNVYAAASLGRTITNTSVLCTKYVFILSFSFASFSCCLRRRDYPMKVRLPAAGLANESSSYW